MKTRHHIALVPFALIVAGCLAIPSGVGRATPAARTAEKAGAADLVKADVQVASIQVHPAFLDTSNRNSGETRYA